MSTELMYLVWVVVLTALLWVPYILNMIAVRGLVDAVGYPADPAPLAPWAQRLKAAHYNAVENLVLFAPLVLTAHVMAVSNDVTVMAAQGYFWARLAHAIVYTLAIPWLRTLTFAVAYVCLGALALQLL